nr:hypothetical protein BaRGS_035190 [Batillaria attramentaria]
MGFEARYVLDWTDHVWTEVYSHTQKRWLHCDPCENVCDKPLLYEQGWGKKLTYVIAFSKDEVQDVTWRYSAKHPEVLARRNECREMWLVNTIHNICTRKFHHMEEARRQEMLHRLVVELVEFLTPKTASSENLPGRTTGSLSWRLARGELGKAVTTRQHQYVFRLMESEKDSEVLHIKYSCAKDLYVRSSSQDVPTWKWHSCTYSARSVLRKEESDWKMAYLARDEGSESAEMSWKFDLIGEDLCISKLELKAPTELLLDLDDDRAGVDSTLAVRAHKRAVFLANPCVKERMTGILLGQEIVRKFQFPNHV